LKKPTGSVQFRFYKLETKKIEPNPNRKKPGKNKPNQKKTEPNWKKLSQNRAKPV